MTDASTLLTLADAGDAKRCGGKAAGLARLLHAGAAVPPGVVLAMDAFEAHLVRCGLAGGVAGAYAALLEGPAQALREQARAWREAVLREPLAEDLRDALQAYLAGAPSAGLMVRSSAPGEDAADASFAGQFDTLPCAATPAALESAVKGVWASAFGERAVRYAQRRGARPAGMAVVVQTRIDARASGVLFTRHPTDPERNAQLLEWCDGPGERLVSGAITPGRACIARKTGAILVEAFPEEGSAVDPATHRAIHRLAALALALERSLGGPQDIEWCIDRDGALWLLQCRPMTGIAPAAPLESWSNANIAENFPAPVTPFLASFVPQGYAAYFRGLGRTFGIAPQRMAAMDDAMNRLVGVQAGRLYYNLSNIHAVIRLAPGGAWLARAFNQFTGAEGAAGSAPVRGARVARITEALRIAVKVPAAYLRVQARLARFERTVDAYAASTAPEQLAARSPRELAGDLRGFLDIRLRRWTDAALADTAAMVCYAALQALLGRWLPGRDQAQLHNDLLQGLPGLASAAPVEALWDLAQRVRRDAAALDALRRAAPEEVCAALDAAGCGWFRPALAEYLSRWGFRYSGELMLTQPTPAENPLPVIRLLQTYVREDRSGPGEITAERASQRVAATARVEALLTPSALRALPLPTRAALFRRVLAATQGAIRLRERARMKQALLYTRLRHVALALGTRLADAGVLAEREDVFFVTTDEALALAEGRGVPDVRTLVTARRAAFRAAHALAPPDRFVLARGETWRPTDASDAADATPGEALRGVGACGGKAQGRAAVLLDVADADGLADGAILVTRQTDPGWAAVFFLVRGLVVERGGMLSHGAIIAREYGIPAVVGVRDATRLIRDGDDVRVDGDAGRVELARA